MRTASFNLADEPWISVVMDGETRMLGMMELFLSEDRITDVVADTDIERWAMRLFLNAVGTTLLDRPDRHLDEPPPPADPTRVERYFAECRERLWLFHPDDPFLQQAQLVDRVCKAVTRPKRASGGVVEVVPVNTVKTLSVELPAKDKHTWWDHLADHDPIDGWFSVEPARAARLVITRHFFGESGNEQAAPGSSDRNSPEGLYAAANGDNNGLFLVMRSGRNLWETICANALRGLRRPWPRSGRADVALGGGQTDRRPDTSGTDVVVPEGDPADPPWNGWASPLRRAGGAPGAAVSRSEVGDQRAA
ncbi:MAG: type I-E CRISPR-associated protein Cse1/CasA [Microthrixaceae bacterium]